MQNVEQFITLITVISSGVVAIIGALTTLLVKYNRSKQKDLERDKKQDQVIKELQEKLNTIHHNSKINSKSLQIYVNGNGVNQDIKNKVNENFKLLKEL